MMTELLTYLPSPPRGVWYLGPIPIRAYALCIVAGILAALWLGDRRWVARGGDRGVVYDIALWAVPFGLVGGRVYHLITDWQKYMPGGEVGPAGAWRIWDGGLGIWGAVALGAVGAWIGCRRRGIPLPAFGDAIAPGIILAQAIGRLGNYFNQELYGRETTQPWGLEIFNRGPNGCLGAQPFDGVSTGEVCAIVHPTFLYELVWNLLVFALLLYVDRRFRMGHGRLFALYVAGYCVGRFAIELMRSDPASMPIADIRVNSFTSALVFIGAVVYMILAPKGRENPALLGTGEPEAGAQGTEPVAEPSEPATDDAWSEPAGDEDGAPETVAVAAELADVDEAESEAAAEIEPADTAPAAEDEAADEDGEDTDADAADEPVAAETHAGDTEESGPGEPAAAESEADDGDEAKAADEDEPADSNAPVDEAAAEAEVTDEDGEDTDDADAADDPAVAESEPVEEVDESSGPDVPADELTDTPDEPDVADPEPGEAEEAEPTDAEPEGSDAGDTAVDEATVEVEATDEEPEDTGADAADEPAAAETEPDDADDAEPTDAEPDGSDTEDAPDAEPTAEDEAAESAPTGKPEKRRRWGRGGKRS
ncbi:prolipoprotein diacylglyceryl transferase [Mycolicibacillus trivialis]|nr:prolipoprotein diacylglyceryl transferase [Mycolicibacillus trivialis]